MNIIKLEKNKKILITGVAGFIGFHLSKTLLEKGHHVVGLDNINSYYDVNLKYARLKELGIQRNQAKVFLEMNKSTVQNFNFTFIRMNLEDEKNLQTLFKDEIFDLVCNLAAQAGVRYSIENPQVYIDSNIQGFLNVLECCRHNQVSRLVYASSSSVYGNSTLVPFKEEDQIDSPVSLYAATKKSNELMAHTYSHLYGFQTIGLRFFTVYGPWGRPDMAMFLFVKAILNDEPIKVFNHGDLSRDFTYIDDIVAGIVSTLYQNSIENEIYQLYNIGNNKPVQLLDFIEAIENTIGKQAFKEMLPMQDGDVGRTWADVSKLMRNFNYKSNTTITKGVEKFVEWYKTFYS